MIEIRMDSSPATLSVLLELLTSLLPSHPHDDASPSQSHTILPTSIPSLPDTSSRLPFPAFSSGSPSLQYLTTYLKTHIFPYLNYSSLSPNYYGFVTGGVTPAALLADWLVSIYDQNVAVHLPNDSIATNVEVAALNQLVDLFQLPKQEWAVGTSSQGGGTFTTGATASNVLGLAMGREWVLAQALKRKMGRDMSAADEGLFETMTAAGVRRVQVLSTLPHSSIAKACAVLGIGRNNVVSVVKEGTELRIDIEKLKAEVSREDAVSILVVSAGEVNTGRFATTGYEEWKEVRKICDDAGVWLHVDGAFGLFGRLLMGDESNEYREIIQGVEGIELADSVTGDGHKLLNVPYDCGFFFTRHKDVSERVFRNGNAAYLTSMGGEGDAVQSPLNIGIENSRRFRALPVHATLIAYGKGGYMDMLKRQIGLARRVTTWLLRDDRYEVLPRSENENDTVAKTFMVVLFRARDDDLNKNLVKNINAMNKIYVTGTAWEGQSAARIAVSNWQADIKRDGKLIEQVLDGAAK